MSNVQLNGVPLVSSDVYVVTANGFLADGGDSFTTFEQVPPTAKLDGGLDLTALTTYLGTNSPVAPPSTDRVNELPWRVSLAHFTRGRTSAPTVCMKASGSGSFPAG